MTITLCETTWCASAATVLERAAGVLDNAAWSPAGDPDEREVRLALSEHLRDQAHLLAADDDQPGPGSTAPHTAEAAALRAEITRLHRRIADLTAGDAQVAALAEASVARQRAEETLAGLQARVETFTGRPEVRLVRLSDLHAKYHDRPGDLVGATECDTAGCGFWDAASFVLDQFSV